MIRDFDFSSASESDSEPGKEPVQEPQQDVKINQNLKRLGISLAGIAVLLAMIVVYRSTIPPRDEREIFARTITEQEHKNFRAPSSLISQASDIPPDRSQNIQ